MGDSSTEPLDESQPSRPCDRTDLPALADMRCGCGSEASEHQAWLRRMAKIKARRIRLAAARDAPPLYVDEPAYFSEQEPLS